MKNKLIQHFFINILFLFVCLILPILFHTLSLKSSILVTITFMGIGFIGSSVLLSSNTIKESLIFWSLSYIVGGLIIGIISIFISYSTLLLIFPLLIILAGIIWLKKGKLIQTLRFEIQWSSIFLTLCIILCYIFIDSDIHQGMSIIPFQSKGGLPDPYFFTLVTHSLSVDSPLNSFYDQGGAINYQIVSFIIPAFFTKLLSIPAQVSLWGIWMPVYKLFGYILLASGILNTVNNRSFTGQWWSLPSVILLLIALAPINPKYILNFEISKIVFLGTGYLLPGGNPPFTMAFAIIGTVLILFNQSKWKVYDATIYIVFISLLVGAKTAMYLPFGIYIGIRSIWQYKTNRARFIYTIISIIPAGAIYYLLFSNSEGLIQIRFAPGYYIEYFNQLIGNQNILFGSVVMIGSLIIWGSIRLVIIMIGFFNARKACLEQTCAVLVALGCTIALPLLLRFELMAPKGTLLQDVSFDLIQFIRAAYFLLTISSITILFDITPKNKIIGKSLYYSFFAYCLLTLSSNIARLTSVKIQEEDQTWRNEVRKEINLKSNNHSCYAIYANHKYSGQLLAAEGIGPWWYTSKRNDGSGYIMTNKNFYRSIVMEQLLNKAHPEINFTTMKTEGVTSIIATPYTKATFDYYKSLNLLIQQNGNKWVFQIK
ncbi:MAG: hypothetical protein JEZ14_09335 [Marinilabiliaceae bacterium]|nr:hypothetical protein [Marinilabiliaceae bacterium]